LKKQFDGKKKKAGMFNIAVDKLANQVQSSESEESDREEEKSMEEESAVHAGKKSSPSSRMKSKKFKNSS
jgi:hypothetical protein